MSIYYETYLFIGIYLKFVRQLADWKLPDRVCVGSRKDDQGTTRGRSRRRIAHELCPRAIARPFHPSGMAPALPTAVRYRSPLFLEVRFARWGERNASPAGECALAHVRSPSPAPSS